MRGKPATFLDSSALVKLAVKESESEALRTYLRRRRPLVASALAQTEVARALLPFGDEAIRRGRTVLERFDLLRLSDRVLLAAGALLPAELRSLDAIHLASALQLGEELGAFVTYDQRMSAAAKACGLRVVSPH